MHQDSIGGFSGTSLACYQEIKCFFTSRHKAGSQFEFSSLFFLLWVFDLTGLARDHFLLLVTFSARKSGRKAIPLNFYYFICFRTLAREVVGLSVVTNYLRKCAEGQKSLRHVFISHLNSAPVLLLKPPVQNLLTLEMVQPHFKSVFQSVLSS